MKQLLYFLGFTLLIACSDEDEAPAPQTQNPPPAVSENHYKQNVGASAHELLAATPYTRLTVEVVAVEGYSLSTSVLDGFEDFLKARLHKPDGIQIKSRTIASPGLAPYTAAELRELEDELRREFTTENTLTVFLFITDGAYSQENVLGLAYRNTSAALMGGRIKELTGGIGQPKEALVMQTVLRHELGHLLGLVDLGSPMQTNHLDAAHGKHCTDTDCLMYYAVETGDFLSNLIGASQPPALDQYCLADLQANGGK